MNTIKSQTVNSFRNLTKTFKGWKCDGELCESIGMAIFSILTIAVMFSAFAQIA